MRQSGKSGYTLQLSGLANSGIRSLGYEFFKIAHFACVIVFIAEIGKNGWAFQPLVCPATCSGSPCYEDGQPCESNLLLGPTIQVTA